MKSSTVRAVLVLLVTFAAGVAAGVAAERLWLDATPADARSVASQEHGAKEEKEEDRRRDDERPRTTIQRFADELGLTREQRDWIEEILARHRKEMHEMWSEIRPRFRRLMDSARADIESVLTEEQTEQYRRLLEREHGDDDGKRWEQDRDADGGGAPDTSGGS